VGVTPHQEVIPLHVILPLSSTDARHFSNLLRVVAMAGAGPLERHQVTDLRRFADWIDHARRDAELAQQEIIRRG
jgi:hypothetical protein